MNHKLLLPITAVFTATLLISNTLDTKIFSALGFDLPAGIILFPLAYLAGDVLTEVYGYAVARRVIWSGLAALVLMVLAYEAGRALPPAAFWTGQQAFSEVFAHVPRIVLASISAYVCGEFVNSFIVAKMKVLTQGRHMALRFVSSTIVGQFVDTTVFVAIAFAGVLPASALLGITLSGWAAKVAWEVIALPITIFLVGWVKRVEQEDFYDTKTNFNPFKM